MGINFISTPMEYQIDSLKKSALVALESYQISVKSIEIINYENNATFKVTATDGTNYAFRINVNSSYITTFFHQEIGRDLNCVVYSWLDGVDVGDDPTPTQLQALGAAMANMHNLSVDFVLPDNSQTPTFNDPFWGSPDLLRGKESQLSVEHKKLVVDAFDEITRRTNDLFEKNKSQLIHADLQYYLDTPDQERALLEGYKSVKPLPKYEEKDLEMLLMHRRLLLLNYLYETLNAEHAKMLPNYLEETIRRVKVFLEI